MPNPNLLQLDEIDKYRIPFNVAQNSYTQYIKSGGRLTDIIIWTNVGMAQKIRQETYTYANNRPATITTTQYDYLGALVETYTETLVYSGDNLSTVTGVLS